MKTKYKNIYFEKHSDGEGKGFEFYECRNNKTTSILGWILYHTPWRKYVFEGVKGCIFDTSCLADIIHFMNQLKKGS